MLSRGAEMVAVGKTLEELPCAKDSIPLRPAIRYLAFHCSFGTSFWRICLHPALDLARSFGKSKDE
jgi:hypothetical protein